ncbi:MAG: UDP-N-acetylmuramoyl-L-alanyl-D-glutamate--2,6-diaminopimelate ligase, partial [Colwellia sp.]
MPKFTFSLSQAQLFDVFKRFNLPLPALAEQAYFPMNCGDLVNDTRKLKVGDVFCAIIGHQQNGNDFIKQAVSLKCGLIIAECSHASQHGEIIYLTTENSDKKIAQVYFYQLNEKLFSFAKGYYQSPQDNMTIIGITGTNGKTSTSQII